MIPVALCDDELPAEEREELARTICDTPRKPVKLGKPTFPVMTWPGDRPSEAYFVTNESWLIFDILELPGDWLKVPSMYWDNMSEYNKLKSFCNNLPSLNDCAERGVHLITQFIDQVQDEEGRQDLLQCVQHWRKNVGDLSKKELENII